jgi:hypothetical protein
MNKPVQQLRILELLLREFLTFVSIEKLNASIISVLKS